MGTPYYHPFIDYRCFFRYKPTIWGTPNDGISHIALAGMISASTRVT